MASPRAAITPEVLKWARERARYSPSEAARKAGTTEEQYVKYEEGEASPTLKQLYKLSKAFRKSVGTFYLESPPEEEEPLREMRKLKDTPPDQESSDLATAVEDVMRRRQNALRMFDDLGEEPPFWDIEASLDDDPESVGLRIRNSLDVSAEEQREQDGPYQALKYWRGLLQESGILCFQVPGVSVQEMRGFAISKFPLPVVAVNRKDSPTARIFTLLHEVGHISLRDSVLHEDYPVFQQGEVKEESSDPKSNSDQEIERFCNEVAAATIIPRDHFLSLSPVRETGEKGMWSKGDVIDVSSIYNISPAVAVRRLHNFDRISEHIFFNLIKDFDQYKSSSGMTSDGGGGDYYRTQLSELGNFYSELAFQAYYNGSYTLSDLSSALDVRVDNIPRYRKEVYS